MIRVRVIAGFMKPTAKPVSFLIRNCICVAIILGIASLGSLSASAQSSSATELFVDTSEDAGIDTVHRSIWEMFTKASFVTGYLGMGQAWGDYNNDGWVDLYLTGGRLSNTLYHNNQDGTFSISKYSDEVSLPDSWTGGAVWADYDNDGFKDLYVLAHGANVLFHNEQGQGFRDVTETAGVGDDRRGYTATWGDYDQDGYLDLFVANWACIPECNPADLTRANDRLYHNEGDGSFRDVSHLLSTAKLQGSAFSASFADYDNDGDLDIYVVNDMVENPIGNVLWRNDGAGCAGWCWHDASSETGTDAVRNGMGLAVGDFDNDLDLDFYFSDMGEPMSLLQNQGTRFSNVTETTGVGGQGGNVVGWGTAFFDFDNNGWLDLFLATTGFIMPTIGSTGSSGLLFPKPNVLFQNQGDGSYLDVTPNSWQEIPKASLGIAYADYDHDGFVDLVVGNFNRGYALYRNTGLAGAEHHWLIIRLEGRAPVNRDAIGARVFVSTEDGLTRMQEVKSGSSFGAGNDTALHFGLGEWSVASAKVVWPDGTEMMLEELAANQILHLVYGQSAID